MVLSAGLVQRLWRGKMGNSEGHSSLENRGHGPGFEAGVVSMGHKEHGPSLRQPDDCGRGAGMEHLPDGRFRWSASGEVSRALAADAGDRNGRGHRQEVRRTPRSAAMAPRARRHGRGPMISVDRKLIPNEILKG